MWKYATKQNGYEEMARKHIADMPTKRLQKVQKGTIGSKGSEVARKRGHCMAAPRYEISLAVLKNISRVQCAHS